jgi:hypothetical protein
MAGDYPTLEELQRKDAERAFRKEHGEFFENFEVIESGTVVRCTSAVHAVGRVVSGRGGFFTST